MTAVAGICSALAVLLLLPARPPRPGRPRGVATPRRRRPGAGSAAVVVGLAIGVLVGGPAGLVLGAGAALGVRLLVPRLESAGARRRREALLRQAPLAIDLVAACLASGAPLDASLEAGARAVGTPTAELLLDATASLRLGADPDRVWTALAEQEGLAPLARAVSRSARTGAPLADLLPRVADEARAAARGRAEARVRTAAVRLTAPLGLALLPAFVLLGIVPVVASWVSVLL